MGKQHRTEMLKILQGKDTLLEKKYEILDGPENTKQVVYFDPFLNKYQQIWVSRIRALRSFETEGPNFRLKVKRGDFGGYIEKDLNLSQQGCCWVADNAVVAGTVIVKHNALVGNSAQVIGLSDEEDTVIQDDSYVTDHASIVGIARIKNNACVKDNVNILGRVFIFDDAIITGYSKVVCLNCQKEKGNRIVISDSAKLYENATVVGNRIDIDGFACIGDNVKIQDCAHIGGNAVLEDHVTISGNACIYDNAEIGGDVYVDGDARIHGFAKIWGQEVYIGSRAEIYGNVVIDKSGPCALRINGRAKVYDYAKICNMQVGQVIITGEARICRTMYINGPQDIISIGGDRLLCKSSESAAICIDDEGNYHPVSLFYEYQNDTKKNNDGSGGDDSEDEDLDIN